jgi:hypothetical protein
MNVPPLPYIVPPPIVNEQRTPVRVPDRIAPEQSAPAHFDVPMRKDQDPDIGALVTGSE